MNVINTERKSQIDRYLYLFRIRHANLSDESADVDEEVEVLITR